MSSSLIELQEGLAIAPHHVVSVQVRYRGSPEQEQAVWYVTTTGGGYFNLEYASISISTRKLLVTEYGWPEPISYDEF